MANEPPSSLESRIVGYYDGIRGVAYPTRRTRYLNFGYWDPDCDDLDDACERLADLLADAAGMREGDRVLDAGFGYADQDMHWLQTRKPELIAGLNITTAQVETARERARERGLADRLDLRIGSATDMPFAAGTFDRVVALESAFHFDTRQDFFREAFRVLRPGGRLAVADVVPLGGRREERVRELHAVWGAFVPTENLYDRHAYAGRLREAGFADIDIRDITGNVYRPVLDHLRRRMRESGDLQMSEDVLGWGMAQYLTHTEYVIASAAKPVDPE
ncbi:SAM-dependent methyltransferase [Streptomyces sp. 7R007]